VKRTFLFFFTFACYAVGLAQPSSPVKFSKQMIAAESYESVDVFDVNGDKQLDLVSGAFWYEGPGFFKRNYIGEVKRHEEYYDDFSTIPMDINGDKLTDFVTGGWFGGTIVWRQNPGNDKQWTEHIIAECGNVETTRAWDVDGDGFLEIVPNTPNKPLVIYQLQKDSGGKPLGTFSKTEIYDKQGHGLGFGDVNKDGRGDFILPSGWLEAPKNWKTEKWIFHPEFNLGTASVPVIVTDVNKDGLTDLIVGQGHGYGLHWYQQVLEKKNRSWKKHTIDSLNSQYHAMLWTDITGDGKEELITGKRYRAHNHNDPGANDPIGLYYFTWNGNSFNKQTINYGKLGEAVGTGIYFSVTDLRGTGRKDIIVAGKQGLYVLYNEGQK
jgi:hypothetical protein